MPAHTPEKKKKKVAPAKTSKREQPGVVTSGNRAMEELTGVPARDIIRKGDNDYALRESEAKFRFLTGKMTDIVRTVDLNLRTTYTSPSIEKVLGFTPEERMRQDVTEQLTPESLSIVRTMLAQGGKHGSQDPSHTDRIITIPLEYYHKNGSTVWLECLISGIRNEMGVLTGIHGVSRDITGRMRMEKDLHATKDFLNSVIDTIPEPVFVKDRQVGMPADYDGKNTNTLGLRLVKSLTEQLMGTIEMEQDGGTVYTITVKPRNPMKGKKTESNHG